MSTPLVAAFVPREVARAWIRRVFPRRRVRLVIAQTPAEFAATFRRELVDAACVDLDHAGDDTWNAARLAEDFPSVAFFGIAPYRATDASAIARCVASGFADVLAHGVDDAAVLELVLSQAFTRRFAQTLAEPPRELGLTTPLQHLTWTALVAHGGRPVSTSALAREVGLTREHLSRRFATRESPNLKRVIDLVRLLAAAELAKNPGSDVADVASVLGYASASHLATAAQRITGAKTASLARLRAVDLVRRFANGRGRSRH